MLKSLVVGAAVVLSGYAHEAPVAPSTGQLPENYRRLPGLFTHNRHETEGFFLNTEWCVWLPDA